MVGTDFNDHLVGGAGDDILVGSAGNDALEDGAGNDRLIGDNGNDLFIGRPGRDIMVGGSGNNTASYATSTAAGVSVSLAPLHGIHYEVYSGLGGSLPISFNARPIFYLWCH